MQIKRIEISLLTSREYFSSPNLNKVKKYFICIYNLMYSQIVEFPYYTVKENVNNTELEDKKV